MQVSLLINGNQYRGWKSINIQKSLMQLAGKFEFKSSNKFPQQSVNWDIKLGDECEILVDNTTLITGYIDNIPESYDKDTYDIVFAGRDKTADLVECSHDGSNEYLDLNIEQIIDNLLVPFDVTLTSTNDVTNDLLTPVSAFAIQQAESILEPISRLCASIGVLPVSFGDGFLTITRAGTIPTFDNIDANINVLSASRIQTNEDRFSEYIVKNNEEQVIQGIDSNQLVGIATDSVITRHRPLIILGEDERTIKACQDRAEWEKRIRAGMSRAVTYKLQGWQQSDGSLWPLNGLVKVKDDYFSIISQLLISNISYNINESEGSTVTMQLVEPDTFKSRIVPLTTEFKSVFG
jgi:prophage tail gpP-like protein